MTASTKVWPMRPLNQDNFAGNTSNNNPSTSTTNTIPSTTTSTTASTSPSTSLTSSTGTNTAASTSSKPGSCASTTSAMATTTSMGPSATPASATTTTLLSASASVSSSRLTSALLRRHNSQVMMWYTTVPQAMTNVDDTKLRHEPTRKSMRRSKRTRIILANPTNQPRTNSTPVLEAMMRQCQCGSRVALLVCVAQLMVGLPLALMAVGVVVFAPYLAATDLSHYTGIPLCMSAWLGAIFALCYNPKWPLSPGSSTWHAWSSLDACHMSCLRLLAMALASLASLACLLSFAQQTLHLFLLYRALPQCQTLMLDATQTPRWFVQLLSYTHNAHQGVLEGCVCLQLAFISIDCRQVKQHLPLLLVAQATLNVVGAVVSAWLAIEIGRKERNTKITQAHNNQDDEDCEDSRC